MSSTRPSTTSTGRSDDAARSLRRASDELTRLLRGQREGYQRLLDCLQLKREAIRSADLDELRRLCEQESAMVQAIGELDKRRLALLGAITESQRPDATRPMNVSEVVPLLDADAGAQLAAQVDALKAVTNEVRQVSSVVRLAADALSRHLTGLMQTVQSALSRAGVYTNRGQIHAGVPVHCAIDIKS